jgi:hypothetical protein
MERRQTLFLLAGGVTQGIPNHLKPEDEREAWVGRVLARMLTIKPGMTRERLLSIFGTEGGISARTWRNYVSVDCAYFKVYVEFTPAGNPESMEEDPRDTIKTISKPFLEFRVTD